MTSYSPLALASWSFRCVLSKYQFMSASDELPESKRRRLHDPSTALAQLVALNEGQLQAALAANDAAAGRTGRETLVSDGWLVGSWVPATVGELLFHIAAFVGVDTFSLDANGAYQHRSGMLSVLVVHYRGESNLNYGEPVPRLKAGLDAAIGGLREDGLFVHVGRLKPLLHKRADETPWGTEVAHVSVSGSELFHRPRLLSVWQRRPASRGWKAQRGSGRGPRVMLPPLPAPTTEAERRAVLYNEARQRGVFGPPMWTPRGPEEFFALWNPGNFANVAADPDAVRAARERARADPSFRRLLTDAGKFYGSYPLDLIDNRYPPSCQSTSSTATSCTSSRACCSRARSTSASTYSRSPTSTATRRA